MVTLRHMYDATHANASVLKQFSPTMVARYLTGTSSVVWTPGDVAMFPGVKTWVTIDQGGPGSPVYKANVVDVEQFAWTVASAQSDFLPKCTAPRPTIYCSRNTLADVTAKCDIWLAAPGLTDAQAIALAATDDRIVAIQNLFAGPYDKTVVIDPTWPEVPVTTPTPPVTTETNLGVQNNWNFCTKCTCLVHVPEAASAPCAAGGNHTPKSHNYILAFTS